MKLIQKLTKQPFQTETGMQTKSERNVATNDNILCMTSSYQFLFQLDLKHWVKAATPMFKRSTVPI